MTSVRWCECGMSENGVNLFIDCPLQYKLFVEMSPKQLIILTRHVKQPVELVVGG